MSRQTNSVRQARRTSAQQKAAAARAAQHRRARRRRVYLVVGSTVGVLAVLGAIVAFGVMSSKPKKGATSRSSASAEVVDAVAHVPAATLDAVGQGTIASAPKRIRDSALTSSGKPQVLFIGAEFCPYCAAERWAIVQALSRFGTFTGLKSIRSSPSDSFPNTATFSFYGARFSSRTLAFSADEVETVTGAQLDNPTQDETTLWHRYTGNPGSFPFLDIGGSYVVTGPSYDPGVLKGMTDKQIAMALADATSPVAKAIDGTANVLTAAICKTTAGQPSSVCSMAGVTDATRWLNG